jgi:hypothetical protein
MQQDGKELQVAVVRIDLAGVVHVLAGDLTRNDASDLERLPELLVRVGDVETVQDPVRKRWTVQMATEGARPLVMAEGLSKAQAQQLADALETLFRVQENSVCVEID